MPQKPRWILANVFDPSAANRDKPIPAFRADAENEIKVLIGAEREDMMVARGADSQSIDHMLPRTQEHELTVVFFVPALDIQQNGKLVLPPAGPTPDPAVFRFKAGAAGTLIEGFISIVYRGRVLQTALISGTALANPANASPNERVTLRLQIVVPGFAGLEHRESFDAAIVAARDEHGQAVAAGVTHDRQGGRQDKTVYFKQPRIDAAAQAIRDVLTDVVTDAGVKRGLDSQAAVELLWKLAQEGSVLYELIGERLRNEVPGDLSRLQLVQADAGAFIPIEFVYELPVPANGAGLCKNWKKALDGTPCRPEHHKTNALGHLEVVCPSGFWSVSKIIERQILKDVTAEELEGTDFGLRTEPSGDRRTLARIDSALFAWSDVLNNTVKKTSAGVLKALGAATGNNAATADKWVEWAQAIGAKRPGLLVLLSHTVDKALEIGLEDSGDRATLAQVNERFVKTTAQDTPIVFLLGCDTAVADDSIYSFVARFRDKGAALVVGTITPVLGERSADVVKAIVEQLAKRRTTAEPFGALMRDARRTLLAQGELTALCATSFGDATWLVA